MTQSTPTFGPIVADRAAWPRRSGWNSRSAPMDCQCRKCRAAFRTCSCRCAIAQAVDRAISDAAAFRRLTATTGSIARSSVLRRPSGSTETAYSRMFAPEFGIIEDPATGSASGPLGCYLVHHGVVAGDRPRRRWSASRAWRWGAPAAFTSRSTAIRGEIRRPGRRRSCPRRARGDARVISFSRVEQAVRQAGAVRRRLVPAQSRREGRARRPQRRRQDDALPDDRRRGDARRRRRVRAEEADHRLLPPGRRGDVGPIGARRSDCRQRPRSAICITSSRRCSTRWPIRRRPTTWIASWQRFGEVQEEYEHLGGYGLESAGARGAARPRLRRRAHRRRRRALLSGGWKMRVAMARVLLGAPDVLLMDEPTNHLDIESIIWLEEFLKSLPGALLMTSHDREFMNRVVAQDRRDRRRRDHGLLRQLRLLRARAGDPRGQSRGGLRAPAGDAGQGAAVHRALRRARREGRAGAEPRQGARQDREDRAAEEAPGREVRLPPAAAVGRPGRRASRACRKAYGARVVYDGLSMTIRRGERWCVMGKNGAGKTTLLKMVAGALAPDAGDGHARREPEDGLLRAAGARPARSGADDRRADAAGLSRTSRSACCAILPARFSSRATTSTRRSARCPAARRRGS